MKPICYASVDHDIATISFIQEPICYCTFCFSHPIIILTGLLSDECLLGTMLVVLSTWQTHCQSSSDICITAPIGCRQPEQANQLGPGQWGGCHRLDPPSPLSITQFERWFYSAWTQTMQTPSFKWEKLQRTVNIKNGWKLRCIATWGRPTTPRQSFSALITRPIPCLKSVNLSVLDF